ncbi:methyltransferase domain-containing protein [Thalassospira tepidiphila]|uniref:Methyltransferase type 11 n=2 Tax=Thalassospira tepidiphila TaxID=393657 RepID=A0A853L3N6_9PROT|nr:class I SAM-dependent methyltransferase [Thalassospira tepidiphila]NJB73944.1 SAM-dependent methyltransferase [Thalassospira tepidiphila]OAZ11897.1 methyltransferase type 11 [Thalassospira tepidiphila MCCC 1A03514]
MRQDVVDLHRFYASSIGQAARRLIRRRLRVMWSDVRGMRVLGFGYATPYLRPFIGEAERVMAFMPAQQGCVHWPAGEDNRVALTEETMLPLPDSSVDRILVVHLVEHTDSMRRLMRECWRVLTPNGRIVVVTPNRSSLWSWSEKTPFGYGHPHSVSQLQNLLRENMFLPIQHSRALFMPPTNMRLLLRWSQVFENIGSRLFKAFAGVSIVEAGKQLYASSGTPQRKRRLVHIPVTVPPLRPADGNQQHRVSHDQTDECQNSPSDEDKPAQASASDQ